MGIWNLLFCFSSHKYYFKRKQVVRLMTADHSDLYNSKMSIMKDVSPWHLWRRVCGWWISLFKESSFCDKSWSFFPNPIKKIQCNLACYFSWVKHPSERCAFRAAHTTNFGRNRSVRQENCKSRLCKICVMVTQEGPVCSVILRNRDILLALNGIVSP